MELKGKSVAVTGATGFVGRHLIQRLLEADVESIHVVTRNVSQAAAVLHDAVGVDRRLLAVHCDIERQLGLLGALKGLQVDVLFHLAAYYGGLGITLAEPASIFTKNVRMGLNVLEASAAAEVDKVVFCGTACSYPGGLAPEPMAEGDFWSGQVHGSVEAYGVAKKAMEAGARAFANQHDMRAVHVVPANLYGPHDDFGDYRSHVVAALVAKAVAASESGKPMKVWGSGAPVREFMYVDDCAAGLVAAAESYDDMDAPLNIGTGVGTSIRELVDAIADAVGGLEVEWESDKPDGAPHKVLDVTKANDLGWAAGVSLQDGIRSTVNWYRVNR